MAFPLRMSMTCRKMGGSPPGYSCPHCSPLSILVKLGSASCLRVPCQSSLLGPTGCPAPPRTDADMRALRCHILKNRRSGTGPPSAHTHPAAARHHERRVVVAVLEATVGAAADQRAHEREEPAARRRVQRRATRVHLSVHVGAVLRGGRDGSGPPSPGRTRLGEVDGAGPEEGRGRPGV